jgi:hypothetical protein
MRIGTLRVTSARSTVMRHVLRLRLAALGAAVGAALLTGCAARPTPAPAPEPEATSLFVRNFTNFDVNLYVVPKPDGKPVWLSRIPVGMSRTLSLRWSDLQANGGLVVRSQIVGSSRTWTSQPLIIDDGIVGVLDLKSDNTLTTAASALRGVTLQAFSAAMR